MAADLSSSRGLSEREVEYVGLRGNTAAGSYKAGRSMVPVLALSITLPSHWRQAMHRVGERDWHLTTGYLRLIDMTLGFLFL